MRSMTLRKAKQKGFTLLELLVVITLLAILATGALLAYEGLTDTAQGAAASNNIATADQSIRNYRAVTGNYPNQWDHLVTDSGDGATGGEPLTFVADATYRFLAGATAIDTSTATAIQNAFLRVGVNEFQVRTISGVTAGVEPNILHNEGAVAVAGAPLSTVELETADDGVPEDFFRTLVVVPTSADGTALCQVGGVTPAAIRPAVVGANAPIAATPALAAAFLNKINDKFESGDCHLVAAFGFGNDAAKSTTGSAVAIASAPTYTSNVINPATTYARYIALFHLGQALEVNNVTPTNVAAENIFRKPVLVGIVDTEGKLIDQNIAVANTTQQQ